MEQPTEAIDWAAKVADSIERVTKYLEIPKPGHDPEYIHSYNEADLLASDLQVLLEVGRNMLAVDYYGEDYHRCYCDCGYDHVSQL
jgi:hypothetical protein